MGAIHEFTRIDEEAASLEIEAGEISAFKQSQLTRHGLRLFKDGHIHTSSYLGQITEADLLQRCQDLAGAGVPYDYALPANSNYDKSFASPQLRGLPALHAQAAEALDFLRSQNDRFIYQGKASTKRSTVTLTNSQGLRHRLETDFAFWDIAFKHRSSRDILDGYFVGYSLDRFDFMDSVKRNLPLLQAFERRLAAPKGPQKIVFADPLNQILHKLSESLRIDRYREGACLFAGKLGQKVFNEALTLSDVRLDLAGSTVKPFDGEGTLSPMDALPLIEKGVFKAVICDLRYGKKYGAASTGNGHRRPDSNASLGFNGLAIGRGQRPTPAMIKALGDCILVTMSMGGDSTDLGDFSLPVALAFQFKGGECLGRLEPFTLTGKVREMFGGRFLEAARDGHEKGALNPCVAIEMNVL